MKENVYKLTKKALAIKKDVFCRQSKLFWHPGEKKHHVAEETLVIKNAVRDGWLEKTECNSTLSVESSEAAKDFQSTKNDDSNQQILEVEKLGNLETAKDFQSTKNVDSNQPELSDKKSGTFGKAKTTKKKK